MHYIYQAGVSGGLAVLFLALVGFKLVGDARGRTVSDLLLIEAAQRPLQALRARDAVGRMGEDLFALVLPGVSTVEQARRSAQRLATIIREPYTLEGAISRVDASVGVALFPADGGTAEQLMRRAGTALERARSIGRSTVACNESDEALADAMLLEQDLSSALELEQFELLYQPIFEARTGSALAFEAVVQWRHPIRGVVPASVFIPLCEQSGVIEKLGRWVLHTACTEAATWAMPVRLAINLSPEQFRRGDLAHQVIETLHHSGLSPDRLDLEVTEAVLLEHSQDVLATMLTLRTLGVRLVLDEFSEASASLNTFRDGAFQQIKIDRSAIASMLTNPTAMAIVRTALEMGSDMRVDVVAEGVDQQVQFDMLIHLGCDQVQGTLLGAPQSPERTRQFLWQSTRRVESGSVLLNVN